MWWNESQIERIEQEQLIYILDPKSSDLSFWVKFGLKNCSLGELLPPHPTLPPLPPPLPPKASGIEADAWRSGESYKSNFTYVDLLKKNCLQVWKRLVYPSFEHEGQLMVRE